MQKIIRAFVFVHIYLRKDFIRFTTFSQAIFQTAQAPTISKSFGIDILKPRDDTFAISQTVNISSDTTVSVL